jgi:predicted kinase
MAGTLIIVCGLPGSGKTTHAQALERSFGAVRFCADEWMDALNMNLWDESARAKIEALQWTVGQRLLAIGQTVLIEWGTWGRSERDALRNGARAVGARVELHYLSAPVDVLFERIQRRRMEELPVTREQVEQWAKALHVPTAEEAASYDDFWSNSPTLIPHQRGSQT